MLGLRMGQGCAGRRIGTSRLTHRRCPDLGNSGWPSDISCTHIPHRLHPKTHGGRADEGTASLCPSMASGLPPRERDRFPRDPDASLRTRDRSCRPPARSFEPAQVDRAPLSASYDKSKIGLQLHPITKKLTWCFTKPNSLVIFLSRNCSRWQEAHFDFEHDSLRSPASAQLALDEYGYEVWDWTLIRSTMMLPPKS